MENANIETLEEIQPKPKKPRTQKQIQAFELARQKRDANRKARAEEKRRQEEQAQMELEDKIVQKAIQIKKREIMKTKVLDEISDEETSIEEVKKIVKPVISKYQMKEIPTTPAIAKFSFI
jgi:hypothetical protein